MVSMCSALSRTVRGAFCAGGLHTRVRHLSVPTGWKLKDISVPGFERVVHCDDPESGLNAVIAIFNSFLGQYEENGVKKSISLGGIRIRSDYTSLNDIVWDTTRLAQGMGYKSALAFTGFGGAKCGVKGDPEKMTQKQLHTLGRFIDILGGAYVGAEDVGSTTAMMNTIAEKTRYVTGLAHPKSSGDPSPFTAYGVMRGMEAACQFLHGSDSLEGRVVAIQGAAGNVGSRLAELLFWKGAHLIVTDTNLVKCASLARKYNAEMCPPKEIYKQKCDIFAPCALGGVLNETTIPALQCQMVVGAANNQLLEPADAERLKDRKILLGLDVVVNSGGISNIVGEVAPEGYKASEARKTVCKVYDTTLEVLCLAQEKNQNTYVTAIELAEERIRKGIGKRTVPPIFHAHV